MDKKALVERCQQGDREALGTLYSTYSARMMKIIRHYISDPADANDILHDGFIVAFTQISSLRDPDKVESWLGTIMRNLSIQYLSQTEIFSLLDEDTNLADTPDIQELISMEELEAIINKLPEGYRKVFKLAVLENKSHAEIGKLLGIAPHTSSSQLFRAKEMLRRIIREHRLELAGAVTILVAILALIPQLFNYRIPELPADTMIVADGTLTITVPSDSEKQADSLQTISKSLLTTTSKPAASAPSHSIFTSHSPVINNDVTDSKETIGNGVNDPGTGSNTVKETQSVTTDNAKIENHVSNGNDTAKNASSNDTKSNPNTAETKINADNEDNKTKRDNKSIDEYRYTNNYIAHKPHRKSIYGLGLHVNASGDMGGSQSSVMNDLANPIAPPPSEPGDDNNKPESRTISRSTVSEEPEKINHALTLTVGATFNLRLTRTLSLESGVRYSYLRSTVEYHRHTDEFKTHYIGVPLKLNLSLYTASSFNIYGSLGAAVDFPIHATKESMDRFTDISAPTQWSLTGGVGLQYRLSPAVSLYIEPSLRYNFHNPGGALINKWQYDRYEFSLPIGLRLNF